jgi:hypothetical protein
VRHLLRANRGNKHHNSGERIRVGDENLSLLHSAPFTNNKRENYQADYELSSAYVAYSEGKDYTPSYTPSRSHVLALIDRRINNARRAYNNGSSSPEPGRNRTSIREKYRDIARLQEMRRDVARHYDEIFHTKKQRDLVSKVVVAVSLFAGGIGLTLLSTNITGNIVGPLNSSTIQVSSAILLVLAVVGGWIYLRKK